MILAEETSLAHNEGVLNKLRLLSHQLGIRQLRVLNYPGEAPQLVRQTAELCQRCGMQLGDPLPLGELTQATRGAHLPFLVIPQPADGTLDGTLARHYDKAPLAALFDYAQKSVLIGSAQLGGYMMPTQPVPGRLPCYVETHIPAYDALLRPLGAVVRHYQTLANTTPAAQPESLAGLVEQPA